jgi:hypothetical protein
MTYVDEIRSHYNPNIPHVRKGADRNADTRGYKLLYYVYCENSEDLSVNLIETHPISRGFRLERSSNNPVLLPRCHMSLWTALLT